jgi:hypothetical protein
MENMGDVPIPPADSTAAPAGRGRPLASRHRLVAFVLWALGRCSLDLSGCCVYRTVGARGYRRRPFRTRKGPSVAKHRLRLLFLVSVVLLSGCAAATSHASSWPVRFVYVTSLDQSSVGLPDVLSVLNARTGKLLWRFQRPQLGITTPVPATDVVYVGASDHTVYAFAASTGQVRWHAQIGGFPHGMRNEMPLGDPET